MIFAEPKVAAEFERHVARAAADAARMRELGPAGLSVRRVSDWKRHRSDGEKDLCKTPPVKDPA